MICVFFAGEKTNVTTGTLDLIMARFVCVIVLHMTMFSESHQGLNIMKYAVNHKSEFEHPKTVWLIGFMQFSMVIIVEVVNMLVISGSNTIVNIVMNFISLAVISDFDDTFYEALPKRLISHIDMTLLIKHTSSKRCDKYVNNEECPVKVKKDELYWVSINKGEPEGEEEST